MSEHLDDLDRAIRETIRAEAPGQPISSAAPNRQHRYVEGLCEHPGEYLRMGDHPDMTGRFVLEDLDPDTLYCVRCEMAVPDISVEEDAGVRMDAEVK